LSDITAVSILLFTLFPSHHNATTLTLIQSCTYHRNQ
jgi:hypothetical protein